MPDQPWGIPDAAAVPVPDAGDDTLRDEVQRITADVIYRVHGPDSTDRESAEQDADDIRDALLPRIREHTAVAVQAERERAIYAIEQSRLAEPWAGYEDGINAGLDAAIDILRGVDKPEPEAGR